MPFAVFRRRHEVSHRRHDSPRAGSSVPHIVRCTDRQIINRNPDATGRKWYNGENARHEFLKGTPGAAVAGSMGVGGTLFSQDASAQAHWTPEKGAKLRVLR